MCNQKIAAKEIKVIAYGGLGDCLLLTPFIKHFKVVQAYRKVTVICPKTAMGIYANNPYIDLIIPCEGEDIKLWALPEVGCDIFSPYYHFSLTTEFEAGAKISSQSIFKGNLLNQPVIKQLARKYKIDLEDFSTSIWPSEEDKGWAVDMVEEYMDKPIVIINRNSRLMEKAYPDRQWQTVVDDLKDSYHLLEILEVESTLTGTHPIGPLPDIGQTAALFKHCHSLISIDSFQVHLAYAVGIPAVVLWGPTNYHAYGYAKHVNLRSEGCPPCANTERLHQCHNRSCIHTIDAGVIAHSVRHIRQSRALIG